MNVYILCEAEPTVFIRITHIRAHFFTAGVTSASCRCLLYCAVRRNRKHTVLPLHLDDGLWHITTLSVKLSRVEFVFLGEEIRAAVASDSLGQENVVAQPVSQESTSPEGAWSQYL